MKNSHTLKGQKQLQRMRLKAGKQDNANFSGTNTSFMLKKENSATLNVGSMRSNRRRREILIENFFFST